MLNLLLHNKVLSESKFSQILVIHLLLSFSLEKREKVQNENLRCRLILNEHTVLIWNNNWHISYLPVKVITDIFKVGEKRHWAEEARQLIPCHRGEAAVFKGTA